MALGGGGGGGNSFPSGGRAAPRTPDADGVPFAALFQAGCGRAMVQLELLWVAAALMLLGATVSLCLKCQLSGKVLPVCFEVLPATPGWAGGGGGSGWAEPFLLGGPPPWWVALGQILQRLWGRQAGGGQARKESLGDKFVYRLNTKRVGEARTQWGFEPNSEHWVGFTGGERLPFGVWGTGTAG